jgi:hypothetical protein
MVADGAYEPRDFSRRTLRMVDVRVCDTHTSSFCSCALGAGATTEGEARHMKTIMFVTSWPFLGVTRHAC